MNRSVTIAFGLCFAIALYAASQAQQLSGGSGGALPGGANGQINYRVSASAFGGISGVTSDGTTITVTETSDCSTAPKLHGATTTTGISLGGSNAGTVSICGGGSESASFASFGSSVNTNFTVLGIGTFRLYNVTSQTSNLTLNDFNSGRHYNTVGASGEVDFSLPATGDSGRPFSFIVGAAQTLKIIANTGQTISIGGTTSASAGNVTSNTKYSSITIETISSTEWVATSSTGSWTVN